jgi:hypothetical protein
METGFRIPYGTLQSVRRSDLAFHGCSWGGLAAQISDL